LLQLFAHFSVISSSPCRSCRQQRVFLDRGRQHRQTRIYAGLSIFQSAVMMSSLARSSSKSKGKKTPTLSTSTCPTFHCPWPTAAMMTTTAWWLQWAKQTWKMGIGGGVNSSNKVGGLAKHPFHLHVDPKRIGHTHPFFIVCIENQIMGKTT
jgi:hypothetical protein